VNLYGISYGTRVAQHYMRRYPDPRAHGNSRWRSAGRSRARPEVAIEAQHAIDSALQRCARSADVRGSFRRFPGSSRHCRSSCANSR
jgi:pimeloyl-ACP methyl ester carboxylesterase